MIHYHGTPITPESDCIQILRGRHALVSHAHPDQIEAVAMVCQSFILDNGAFSLWTAGKPTDWPSYYEWAGEWLRHPGCDWALIPDVIDGDERQNDKLVEQWPHGVLGVPVWHLHESLDRLRSLRDGFARIALGSSGQYATVGTWQWRNRMAQAMDVLCPDGVPLCKIHALRMLDPDIFRGYPFGSADSCNIARNIGIDKNSRWAKRSRLPGKAARGIEMAMDIEAHQSCATWRKQAIQEGLIA